MGSERDLSNGRALRVVVVDSEVPSTGWVRVDPFGSWPGTSTARASLRFDRPPALVATPSNGGAGIPALRAADGDRLLPAAARDKGAAGPASPKVNGAMVGRECGVERLRSGGPSATTSPEGRSGLRQGRPVPQEDIVFVGRGEGRRAAPLHKRVPGAPQPIDLAQIRADLARPGARRGGDPQRTVRRFVILGLATIIAAIGLAHSIAKWRHSRAISVPETADPRTVIT